MSVDSKAPKVILWAVPRSVSSALMRAMNNKKDIKVILEPYGNAFYFGPERSSSRLTEVQVSPEATFQNVRIELEKETQNSSPTFVKEMAFFFAGKLGTTEYLPKGYMHTFIIRNPKKSIHSLYKLSVSKDVPGWNSFDASEVGFSEVCSMLQLVTEQLGQEAIIIDADDLLENPAAMVKLYCEKTGIEFEPEMLEWKEAPQKMEMYQPWSAWFKELLKTSKFEKSVSEPVTEEIISGLPSDVQQAIEDSMPFYQKMYEKRLRP